MAHSESIAEALFDCITNCSDPQAIAHLDEAIKGFKEQSPRSYRGVRRQPFAANVLDGVIEALEFIRTTAT